jgi:hypothetical protein
VCDLFYSPASDSDKDSVATGESHTEEPELLDELWADLSSGGPAAPEAAPEAGGFGQHIAPPLVAPVEVAQSSGATSSSSVAPPVVVSSVPVPEVCDSNRVAAAFVAFVPGGKITYYDRQNKVEAVCLNWRHGKCVLTRSMAITTRSGMGRPLGLCMAWLAKGASVATKVEHWADEAMPSRAERVVGRIALKAMGSPGSVGLLSKERAKVCDAEESEPEV